MDLVISIVDLIIVHYDKVNCLKGACKMTFEHVTVLKPLLENYSQSAEEADQPWISRLNKGLETALETIKLCSSDNTKDRIMATLLPGKYTERLKDACEAIRQAIEAMSLSAATVMRNLQSNFQVMLTDSQTQSESAIKELKEALSSQNDDILNAISDKFGVDNGEELKREIAKLQGELKEKAKETKESHLQTELDYACELSKLSMGRVSGCHPSFLCPISKTVMDDPVILVQSGHTYERKQLALSLAHKPNVDPVNRSRFDADPNVIPNRALRNLIEDWKKGLSDPDYNQHFDHPRRSNKFLLLFSSVVVLVLAVLYAMNMQSVPTIILPAPIPTQVPSPSPLPTPTLSPTPTVFISRFFMLFWK
jgi:hypothetical protein